MEQKKFVYALYHDEKQDVSETLSRIECIKDHQVMVSINSTACRGKDPIDDKRSTVEIEIKENSTFKDLDDQLEQMFTDIWFEH
jgi:hypothetical protein